MNNRGISLVELIVVTSILAVMVGVTALGISVMFSRDANYVAGRIDDELSEARMLAMSKSGKYEFVLSYDSGAPKSGTVKIDVTDASGTKTTYKEVALDKDVTIELTGASFSAKTVTIEFDKANGSVSLINGATPAKLVTFTVKSNKNTSKTRKVTLVTTTGRHYTEE